MSAKDNAINKAKGENKGSKQPASHSQHKHNFYLKTDNGISGPFYRQCDSCGKKARMTKYKMEI